MRILIVDAKSWTPYDGTRLNTEGIGGTEASVVRVAQGLAATQGLAARHNTVAVAQLFRPEPALVDGVHYLPFAAEPFVEESGLTPGSGVKPLALAPDIVVVLRKLRLLRHYRRLYPRARLFCWLHNWQRPEALFWSIHARRYGAQIVTVSEAHRQHTERVVNGFAARSVGALLLKPTRISVQRIYNPIATDLRSEPDSVAGPDPMDSNQLIYLSTANKGLAQVLRTFAQVRERLPELRLLVAGTDPDVLRSLTDLNQHLDQPGVEILGRLPRPELYAHLQRSLCVFYPQDQHAETFGLIFAEAHALGTPVLAHDFGAAREILNDPEQLVAANDLEGIISRLRAWQAGGRPRVSARPEFQLESVLQDWLRLLAPPGAS